MSYVRKLGASALVIAAAFAVAFAVLVSSTTTDTVEAATIDFAADDTDNAVTAAPGDTVNVAVASAFANVTILSTADGVGGSFVASGGQSVQCSDDGTCDVDDSEPNTTGRQNVAGAVSVALKIDDDSGEGHILLSVGGLGTPAVTKVITVSKASLVGSLKITASPKTIAAADGESTLTINVQNAAGTPAGLNGEEVSVVTTLGSIECVSGTETQACTATTADSSGITNVDNGTAGYAQVTLNGKGVEGVATITARLGSHTATATVTMFGTAKNLTAEPQQGSVEIGGSVFIVLTVTDGAGNPVAGQVISPATNKEVVGPADDAVLVTTSKDATADNTADGSGYNVDLIDAKDSKNSIPACGDDKDPVTDASATPPTTEDFATNGTNSDGKCVVQVNTQKAEGTTKATTRGEHTLNFQISATLKTSATIEVAGAPASITTDAPAMVDPGSVTEITVSVFDDEDVLVGITSVKVRRVDGGGLIEDEGTADTPGSEMTADGQSKFTFIAPSAIGSSEILITAGKVNHRVTIQIGEEPAPPPPPEPEPEPAPSLNVNKTVSGTAVAVFTGGSIEEFDAALAAACGDGARAWVVESQGSWVSYRSGAAPVLNRAFTAHFAGGIPDNTGLVVTDCD